MDYGIACGDDDARHEARKGRRGDPEPITVEVEIDKSDRRIDIVRYTLPTRWAVCPTCDGRGFQALHGLDVTDCIQEDPDFAEDYLRGDYDTPCSQCQGRRLVAEVDRQIAHPEALKAYDEDVRALAELRAEEEAERRMGA